MAAPDQHKAFVRQVFLEHDHLLAARWWHESLQASATAPSRRDLMRLLAVAGGGLALGGMFLCAIDDDDERVQEMDALDAQRREGWNVGHTSRGLSFRGGTPLDAAGTRDWYELQTRLPALLAPQQEQLAPYQVPTLMQSLGHPSNASLRASMQPVFTPQMDQARDRAVALAELFEEVGGHTRTDTAVILDLPGPESVAAASGLAPWFEPVFVFDNWPHPAGVVPAHETLGALLFELPRLRSAAEARAAARLGGVAAPPVFVLDANRLLPYTDAADRFDNRSMARLPTDLGLRKMGIAHVLYVTPDAARLTELDDLNDDFVGYERAGIDVRLLSLATFARQEVDEASLTAARKPDAGVTGAQAATTRSRYYWGGHPHTHVWFWHGYGWHAPTYRHAPSGPAPALRPAPPTYRPAPRPTLFTGRTVGGIGGVGKQRPSGFGRISYRTSSSGRFSGIGVRSGRSGSFGRSRSSWSG